MTNTYIGISLSEHTVPCRVTVFFTGAYLEQQKVVMNNTRNLINTEHNVH